MNRAYLLEMPKIRFFKKKFFFQFKETFRFVLKNKILTRILFIILKYYEETIALLLFMFVSSKSNFVVEKFRFDIEPIQNFVALFAFLD